MIQRPRSHVGDDGLAKRAFTSEREAIERAAELSFTTGRQWVWYQCHLAPAHWHLSTNPTRRLPRPSYNPTLDKRSRSA